MKNDEKLIELMARAIDPESMSLTPEHVEILRRQNYAKSRAADAITALTAAGYRIVPEGGDAEALAEAAEPFAAALVNYVHCGDWQTVIVRDNPESEHVSVAQLRDLCDALSAFRGGAWRPIITAPKNGTKIELRVGGLPYEGYWVESPMLGAQWRCANNGHALGPTHWRPLPPAPDREGE